MLSTAPIRVPATHSVGAASPYDYPPGYGPNAAPNVVTLFLSLEYAAVLDMCTCMVTRLPQGEAAVKQVKRTVWARIVLVLLLSVRTEAGASSQPLVQRSQYARPSAEDPQSGDSLVSSRLSCHHSPQVRQSAISGTLQTSAEDEASEGVLLVAPALMRILSACADVGEVGLLYCQTLCRPAFGRARALSHRGKAEPLWLKS